MTLSPYPLFRKYARDTIRKSVVFTRSRYAWNAAFSMFQTEMIGIASTAVKRPTKYV